MENFSATKAISFGWETFKKRPGFFIGVTLAVFIASMIVSAITDGRGFILWLVGFCLSTLISLGMGAVILKAHDDVTQPTFADLWHPQHYLSFLGTSFLMGLIVMIGIILLIVPGIIAAVIFGFATLIVIDRGLDPIAALKESMRITAGKRWEIFVLFLLALGINIVGILALIVGLLVTVPVTALAFVHAYRVLSPDKTTAAPAQDPATVEPPVS